MILKGRPKGDRLYVILKIVHLAQQPVSFLANHIINGLGFSEIIGIHPLVVYHIRFIEADIHDILIVRDQQDLLCGCGKSGEILACRQTLGGVMHLLIHGVNRLCQKRRRFRGIIFHTGYGLLLQTARIPKQQDHRRTDQKDTEQYDRRKGKFSGVLFKELFHCADIAPRSNQIFGETLLFQQRFVFLVQRMQMLSLPIDPLAEMVEILHFLVSRDLIFQQC